MSFGLDAAVKALNAARLGIQTAGQNVANAATPGYSRQRLLLSAALPFTMNGRFQVGTGVEVNGIVNTVDEGLELRLRLQLAVAGRAEVDVLRWGDLEGLFNEPGGGLSTQFSDLFGKVGSLQADASDDGLRSGVIQSGKALSSNLNLLADRIRAMRDSTFSQIDTLVRQVNQHADAIAKLNRQILAIEANGVRANDLRDTREQNVKQISQLIDIRSIERSNGSVDLTIEGRVLVAGERTNQLRASTESGGRTNLTLGSSKAALLPQGGRIAGLMAHETAGAWTVLEDLDQMAHNLALEFNRIHSTGVPKSGSFQSLTSFYAVQDADGDGQRGDEVLSQTNLPFDVMSGDLFVSVTNTSTGQIERTKLAIDTTSMSLQDVAQEITRIQHLTATVDPSGRLRVNAESGYGFDFANRLDAQPDSFGSFGGTSPSVATTSNGPFDLSAALAAPPATFTVSIDGAPQAVSLDAADFSNASAATVDELVTAINADVGAAATAKNVGGRLVIRSNSSGSTSSLSLTDGAGSPLSALGLPVGVTRMGQDAAVSPQISGQYTGSGNGQFVFVPDSDGDIGSTPGLTVSVYDGQGVKIATLGVGDNYSPGTEIEVADGVKVAFGPGTISSSFNDVFALDTIEDSDTTDLLVAVGLNSFYHGSTASDLTVNPALEANPDLLAAGLSGAAGNGDNLGRFLELRNTALNDLDNLSIEDYYSGIVGDIGFESEAAQATLGAQENLLASLQQQRDSVSGVNIDEEMVDMMRFQQAFDASSRFVSVVNQISQTLMDMVR